MKTPANSSKEWGVHLQWLAFAVAISGTLAWSTVAQATSDAQASPNDDVSGMDHPSMPGMTMPNAHPSSAASKPSTQHDSGNVIAQSDWSSMRPDVPADDLHSGTSDMDHGSGAGKMTRQMQGGSAPANARSPDYSDGVGHGPMEGMDMADDASLGMLLIDQLEAFHGSDVNGQAWEAEGWVGNDRNKAWLRSEGERSGGQVNDADVEIFWNRNVAPFWSTQLGARHDFGNGPSRTWAALGVQGIAPYWFELEATAYAGPSGRTAARLRSEYELLLTQRLILQPELELNFYGKDDPLQRTGSGLSDAQASFRLRYEATRQFAPYIGVSWTRRIGTTADYAREDDQSLLDRQIVAGIHFWF